MASIKHLFFFVAAINLLYSCGNKPNCPGQSDTERLQKVSVYFSDSIVAATYYSTDTNWAELAKALWQEKTKLLAEKDSTTIFYLLVFNNCKHTPDISADYTIAWTPHLMTYRYCILDNGFGFTRFCYGIRLDEGRIGDWAYFRNVNNDGSLAKVK